MKPTQRNRSQDQLGRSGSAFPIRLLALTLFAVIVGSASMMAVKASVRTNSVTLPLGAPGSVRVLSIAGSQTRTPTAECRGSPSFHACSSAP